MTDKFSKFCEMMVAGIMGGNQSSGGALTTGDTYAPGDSRVPKVMGPTRRRIKKNAGFKKNR
jgi:hypothetical protein